MENVNYHYTPQNSDLTLVIKDGETFGGKCYIELEVADSSFPKMPRQFYMLRICPQEEQHDITMKMFKALNEQYPGYEWIKSVFKP